MIWRFCIRRPVFTVVAFLVIAIFGVYGYIRLPVRENPDVDYPIVSVSVVLAGAEPEVIETEIIEPLEEELNTIEGLKELRSTAREQVASITAEFELWRDIDVAAQDVRDRVDRALRDLPDDIEAPLVQKLDPDARAIMWIALTGNERWDPVRLSEYADKRLKEQLENIRGVGQIQVGGERAFAVRVRLDRRKLAAHGVTAAEVVRTIQQNNVDIPAGRVESRQREFLVKVRGQFASAEPISELVVASRGGAPVRISDLGEVVDSVKNDRQLARFAGEASVGLGVVKQSDANTVALADAVRARMNELARSFPPGLAYEVATDDSTYIKDNLRDLLVTIFLAAGLVVVVVLVFLRTGAGTVITSLAIPTSLLAGVAFINAAGFSLNTLTMLGFILVVGIVVDDAIVILESNYRHLEQSGDRKEAARTGTAEVAFPAIANSMALAAVFIPVAFTGGMVGRFFFEFGVTVAVTVFASTLTALTLTPMLCSRLLRVSTRPGRLARLADRGIGAFEGAYRRTLALAFGHRALTIVAGVVAALLGGLAFSGLQKEFLPAVDRAGFMIVFETPEGATLRETDVFAHKIERVLADTEEVTHQFLAIGLSRAGPGRANEGIAFVHLTPATERARHQEDVMDDVRGRLAALPDGQAYVVTGGGVGGRGSPIQAVLQGTDVEELAAAQDRVMAWMRGQRDFVGVHSDLRLNKPQVEVTIHRDKASQMGITVADISGALRFLLGEPEISRIERQSERYDVITEAMDKGHMTPEMIGSIHVRTAGGALVSLDNLVDLREGVGPSEIHHFNRLRSVTVSASTPPGVPLGEALGRLRAHLDGSGALPAQMSYAFAGQAQDFQESFRYLTLALVFSVVFIYLILSAQFESFLHPLVILLALPLATVGAFGGLYLLGMTLNIFSFIGLIMLLGMATKNAILLVDYTNVLASRGKGPVDAAREAARVRFRPVVMTTFSTVLGMMPIALGFGAGGEARAPLGVAVAAGLLATTFLTLVVIPVVVSLVGQGMARVRERRAGRAAQGQEG